ncbi:MAG: IclR family transcriptional regulator [Alphaproteobacteria bacterium]|nr:IclR family transcriptional regulator [Alphaproteobacteria bacterium]
MNIATQNLRKPVVAVQRAVQIMRFLGSVQRPAGVNEVSRALGIVPSTCQHILKTLDHDGLVSEDRAAKKYQLGPTLLRFARDMVGSNDFVRNAQGVLDRMAGAHQVTTAAVWREGTDRIIVVAKAHAPANFSLHVNIGSRFPALTSAIGHCFAAAGHLDPDFLRTDFDELQWQNQPDFEAWKDDVAFARANGYAVDAGYYIGGITVIAAPVHEAVGGCTRAVVALGLSEQLKGPALDALGRDLKSNADALSEPYSESVV